MADRRRPQTSAPSSRRTGSIASRYLDLRPLPEDVLLEVNPTLSSSFDTKGSGGLSGPSWKEEGEHIKKQIRKRLPSASHHDEVHKRALHRPATAPQLGHTKIDRDNYASQPQSLRNARYLAIQWRSRATQLQVSNSFHQTDQPPSLRESDSGSEESEVESDNESEHSDFSSGSIDESIKSQVSDAQKVVEKWKLRFSESLSVCSDTASRDEEEENRIAGMEPSKVSSEQFGRYGPAVSDEFHFAMRPSTADRELITNEDDGLEILSALKPYPLQPVNSGMEFFSESQQHLLVEGLHNEESEPMEDTVGVFVTTESGRVADTLKASATKPYKETDNLESVNEDDDSDFNEDAQDDDDGDDMISVSRASSQDDNGDDDHLSINSTPAQSFRDNDGDANLSYGIPNASSMLSYATNQSNLQTFCDVPESFKDKLEAKSSQNLQNESATSNKLETNDVHKPAVTEKKQEGKKATQPVKEVSPPPPKEKKYTGTVQERIEAVKRAKAAEAAKKKAARPSSSKSKKGRAGKSKSTHARKNVATKAVTTEVESKPIRWVEHNVVFTFGLLTADGSAPPTGAYSKEDEEAASYKNRLKTRSKLLHEIMKNFREILQRTKSLGDGSTKYMMVSPDTYPRPIKVKRDDNFRAPDERPRIKRSVIMAVVPIFVPDGDARAKEIATHVILDIFSMAISRGEFAGQKFEKVA